MKRIVIIDGYYGSGKTTYCKDFLSKHSDYVYVNIDLLCAKLKGNQRKVKNHVLMTIQNSEKNILIDFYFKKKWKQLLCTIKGVKNAKIDYMFLPVSVKESYERFTSRSKSIHGDIVSFDSYCKRLEI